MIGADIVADARSYLGVPWKHQGRTRRGVDCAGLVRQVAYERGLTEFDTRNYAAQASDETMLALCSEHMDRVPLREMAAGDVVVMSFESQRHMGFIGDYLHGGLSLIHACALYPRKVVEVRLDEVWRGRIMAAFRFRGVA